MDHTTKDLINTKIPSTSFDEKKFDFFLLTYQPLFITPVDLIDNTYFQFGIVENVLFSFNCNLIFLRQQL